MSGQPVQGFVQFGQAALLQGLTQQGFGGEIMSAGVEFKDATPHVVALQFAPAHWGVGIGQVDAGAGQYPCQFLHVFLAVGSVHAQGVQLHEFARQVLVDAVHRVLFVVQVAQHGRVKGGRAQQIAKAPQRMRANGAVLVVAHHGANVGLVLENAEMVQPEPSHLLLQLARGVQRAQHMAGGGFTRQPVEFLLVGLLGRFFVVVVLERVGIAAALLQLDHQGGEGFLTQG